MRCTIVIAVLFTSVALATDQAVPVLKLTEDVRKIWDEGPHNAFTDLIRFEGRWYCAFREGTGHAAGAGKLRVIVSDDTKRWQSVALLEENGVDLRDPHLSITPDGRLMLNTAAAEPASRDPVRDHYSIVSFSKDGRTWTKFERVLGSWQWLWRVTWHKGTAYGVAYGWDAKAPLPKQYKAALYKSKDGLKYEKVTDFRIPQTTEATLAFDGDTLYCLQRRDGKPNTAMLGRSSPPYADWDWKDLGVSYGGPNLLRAPDGVWWTAGRLIEKGKPQTVLCRLHVKDGALKPVLTLPCGGDNSYAGLVWHQDHLWVSYYSSHEKKASIYLARAKATMP